MALALAANMLRFPPVPRPPPPVIKGIFESVKRIISIYNIYRHVTLSPACTFIRNDNVPSSTRRSVRSSLGRLLRYIPTEPRSVCFGAEFSSQIEPGQRNTKFSNGLVFINTRLTRDLLSLRGTRRERGK